MLNLRITCILVLAVAVAVGTGTPISAQNLVANGDFEGGWGPPNATCDEIVGATCCLANGWLAWNVQVGPTLGSTEPGNPTWTAMPGQDCSADPGANNYQRIRGGEKHPLEGPSYGSNCRGGLVQTVATTPGVDYDLDMQLKFSPLRGTKITPGQAFALYGIDKTGQTSDAFAETVEWKPNYSEVRAEIISLRTDGMWNQHADRFTATGNSASIWFMLFVPDDATGIFDVDNVIVAPAAGDLVTITEGPAITKLTDTSFRIDWTTDVPTDSRVEYGSTVPNGDAGLVYDKSKVSGDLTTEHSVVVNGLAANTTYHYRVLSGAPGYKTVSSFDGVFITPPPARPFFENGGFEDTNVQGEHTLAPWISYGVLGGGEFPDGLVKGSWFFAFAPTEGEYFLGTAGSYDVKNGGVYQRIKAVPGAEYTASMDYRTQNWDFDVQIEPIGRAAYDDVQAWLGIDPTGGVDPEAPTVVWGKYWIEGYDFIQPGLTPGQWSPPYEPLASVSVTAEAPEITVFIRMFNKWSFVWNIMAVDNVKLQGPVPPPDPVETIGALKGIGVPAFFGLQQDAIVTVAPTAELGVFYMQDPDGTAGVKVISDTFVSVGDTVRVSGVLELDALGEQIVAADTVTITGSGAEAEARTINNRDIGGQGFVANDGAGDSTGLSNEGLLMKTFGKVTKMDFVNNYLLVDDGSGVWAGETEIDPNTGQPYRGIRFTDSNFFPSVGSYVKITGVVTRAEADGKTIRVLRGREGLIFDDNEIISN